MNVRAVKEVEPKPMECEGRRARQRKKGGEERESMGEFDTAKKKRTNIYAKTKNRTKSIGSFLPAD